jgi:hypothetical protein
MWDAVKAERPDLYRAYTPWDRISESAGLQTLLESAGATAVTVLTESDQHRIQTPEDWWTMVMGGGWRGTIDQMDAHTVDRIRQVNLDYLVTSGVRALDVEVLYAIGQK